MLGKFPALREGILRGIGQRSRLIVSDVLHAQELEHLEQRRAHMVEGDRAVMRVALAHQHVAVEAAHFGDGEHADAAEGAGGHGQHFAFCHIGAQLPVGSALQPEEGDLAGGDVALQGAAGEVRVRAGGLQQAVLDELVLHGPVGAQLAAGGVAAVEAHEGVGQLVVIIKFALDLLREKKILLIHGGGFNWKEPDHFRVVYLPRVEVLEKAARNIADFLRTYQQN